MEETKPLTAEEEELTKEEKKELGLLFLGVVIGAALGIVGNLWVAFLIELIRNLVSSELWTAVSILGLVITTILSLYILKKLAETAAKYIIGEERLADRTEKKEV